MKQPQQTRRSVAITAAGFVSPLGNSAAAVHEKIILGSPFFQRPDFDPFLAVAKVMDFDVKSYTGRCKETRYLNRGASFAVASAVEAVKKSGLTGEDLENAGLFVACGPNMDIGGEFPDIRDGRVGQEKLAALFLLKFLPNTATSLISRLTGVHGENSTVCSACAASLMAIGEAFRRIRDGYLDVALAGGGDSRLSETGLLSYKKAGALWEGPENPEKHYSPFGKNRKGFIPGEGGAFFVLESLEHALERNAKILCEITGYGATMDGHAMTAPDPEGTFAEKAVRSALSDAELDPGQVDLISAHGTGTELNDRMESLMISRVFEGHRPKIISFKSRTGHLASACGAVELALCLACIEGRMFPGLENLMEPVNGTLDFMRESHALDPRHILLENFGFGGQNAALTVQPWIR
jgi:3-oxoacyl-[acyl-carrier-protein] synthase II